MHPIIGITMGCDQQNLIHKGVPYSYIRQEYGKSVYAAGGQPIFLDASIAPAAAAQLCDGIIISGGYDIDPAIYDQARRYVTKIEPVERTVWEGLLIDASDERAIPILGICYGEQLLNVHYGGTLYQDIAAELVSPLDHGGGGTPARHKVTFERDFLGYKTGDEVVSAARHHQAVHELARGFQVVARTADGVIEAITGHGHYGVQWHAESDSTARKIYGEFIRICRPLEPIVPSV